MKDSILYKIVGRHSKQSTIRNTWGHTTDHYFVVAPSVNAAIEGIHHQSPGFTVESVHIIIKDFGKLIVVSASSEKPFEEVKL